MLETCYIAVIISILLCHGPQASKARPSDLDTSVFSLDYDYDSEPYLPTNLGLKEAKMVDPWTLDFRHKLASQKNIDTFAAKVAAPLAQARMFIQEEEEAAEKESKTSVPSPAKLIDNRIPNAVTEVPSIEVPTKFEGLLDDPTIVFKSASGSENRVNAKVIRRLKDKKTAMDRAREMLRKRLNVETSTTQSPFITVVQTTPRGRPKPFSKLQSKVGGGTTLSTLIRASTTVPPNTSMSVRDKMVAARNRLRLLMGQGPIGITSTPRTMPTTPTPSTPTKMDIARQKVKDQLELERELEEAFNTTDMDPENANLVLPDDSQIAVTPKSTKGDVDNPDINPLVLISPTFPPGSNQFLPNPDTTPTTTTTTTTTTTKTTNIPRIKYTTTTMTTTTTASTAKPTMKELLDATTLDDVLDVPTRMQDTLMRLMKKTGGLKRDPFAKLVTTAVTLIDEDQDYEDFTAPSPHQDPFLSQNLHGQANEEIEGLSTPPTRQNPLLRQLQRGRGHGEPLELELPADPLNDPDFKPARPHHRFNPDALNLPRRRQNPLLRILRFDRREKILSKGLSPPRYRQNPLFRQLVTTPQRYRNDFLQLPPKQQNKLLAILKRHGGDNFNADALLTLPQLPEYDEYENDFEDEEDYEYEDFVEEFTVTTPSPTHRPKMPKSKFEVLQIRGGRPVEEVTFQRVNEPLTLKDKKEELPAMPLIQLEPAASSVAPIFVENRDDDDATTTSTATTTTGTDSPDLLDTTANNDVIFFSLKPEETTELSATSDILHDEFSLHEHDETTNAGMPLDAVELTTEFGTLNFEDIMPTSEIPSSTEPEYQDDYDYTGGGGIVVEDPDFELEEEQGESAFEEEMRKVVEIMKIAGDDLTANTIKTMVSDLVSKARQESKSKEEQIAKVKMVTNLVQMFKATNAQRATDSFLQRKPTVNPVQEELGEIADNFQDVGQEDFSQILIEKAKKRPSDFRDIVTLELPRPNRPRLHMKPKDFSDILINKAKNRPQKVKDFDTGLEVPTPAVFTSSRAPQDFSQILINKAKNRPSIVKDFRSGLQVPPPQQNVAFTTRRPLPPTTEDFSQVLLNKAKNKPKVVKDFQSGLELPTMRTPTRDFAQVLLNKAKSRPDQVKDFKVGLQVPTTPKPVQVTTPTRQQELEEDFSQILFEKAKNRPDNIKDFDNGLDLPKPAGKINLTEMLNMPTSKEMIEDHLMEMIIENPERAAADLADLFDLENEAEKEDTEEELFEMMEKDPLAVTSAFTDLILAQKNQPVATDATITDPPTTPFDPVKIEPVPEAVRGQMMRMTKKKPELSVEVADDEVTDTDLDILDDMMQLIQDGELSQKEVIEELINNGVLPVEVTEIGRIPIIVGASAALRNTPSPKKAPLRQRPNFQTESVNQREEINLARLQQLKVQEPQMVMRDHHDVMTEVSLDDPDSDFEMLRPKPIPTVATEAKDIEILSSMMDLYDQGMISEEELEQMVIMMEAEGVLDVDLQELGLEKTEKKPSSFPSSGFSYSLNSELNEGPSRPEGGPDVFGFKSRPLIGKPTEMSYAHFSMSVPKTQSTALPPELPPPSTESVHNAPFFEELRMDNPFKDPFENTFANADLEFKPKKLRDNPRDDAETLMADVKPGPAPPYYMAARLPAPPKFQPSTPRLPPTVTEVPFLSDEEVQPLRMRPLVPEAPGKGNDPIFELFDTSLQNAPREPFPPPGGAPTGSFKRHVHQPLPLILHQHEGTGFKHPHFDIPSSLINPDEYMRHPKQVVPHHASFEDAFLRRKGKMIDEPETLKNHRSFMLHPSESRISLTGYRPVDKKLDEIRKSFLKGDSLGSSMSLD